MFLTIDSVNNVVQFIVLIIIFAIVLGACYFTTRFIANFQQGKMANSNIKVIEATRIGQNKFIEIVLIGQKYYAIAIAKDTVTLIGEIDESELNLEKDTNVIPEKFSSVLEKIKLNKK